MLNNEHVDIISTHFVTRYTLTCRCYRQSWMMVIDQRLLIDGTPVHVMPTEI